MVYFMAGHDPVSCNPSWVGTSEALCWCCPPSRVDLQRPSVRAGLCLSCWVGWKENAALEAAASQRTKEQLVLFVLPSFALLLDHYNTCNYTDPPQHSKLPGCEHLRSTSGREESEQINILSSEFSLTFDIVTFPAPDCSGIAHPLHLQVPAQGSCASCSREH